MSTVKTEAIKLVQGLPDDCTWDQVVYRVYLRAQIEKGLADVAAGRVVPHEEVKKQVSEWLKSFGPKEPATNSG
ncbi:MAG: hypothetical protein C0467_26870 [Planctomycetaceae bacterium]|nr:hypothetical protein [Planctomycetaceae bacterium]